MDTTCCVGLVALARTKLEKKRTSLGKTLQIFRVHTKPATRLKDLVGQVNYTPC
jgi:hypothetical protein